MRVVARTLPLHRSQHSLSAKKCGEITPSDCLFSSARLHIQVVRTILKSDTFRIFFRLCTDRWIRRWILTMFALFGVYLSTRRPEKRRRQKHPWAHLLDVHGLKPCYWCQRLPPTRSVTTKVPGTKHQQCRYKWHHHEYNLCKHTKGFQILVFYTQMLMVKG